MAYLGHIGRPPGMRDNLVRHLSESEINLKTDESDNKSGINIYEGNSSQKISEFNYDKQNKSWMIDDRPVLFKTEEISSSKVLKPYTNYYMDSTVRPIVLFLPQFPKHGDELNIVDLKLMFDVNNVTVYRNHNRIGGTTQDVVLDVKGANVNFKYINDDVGWVFSVNHNIIISPIDIQTSVDEQILPNVLEIFTGFVSQFTDKIGTYLNTNLDLEANPSNHLGLGIINFLNYNVSRLYGSFFCNLLDATSKLIYDGNTKTLKVDRTLDICTEFSDFNAKPFKNYWVNTVGHQVRVMLPINPCEGDWIVFFDHEKSFDVNSVIIEYNGIHSIDNVNNQLELNSRGSTTRLVFKDANWFIF